jgi:hypothetical protein
LTFTPNFRNSRGIEKEGIRKKGAKNNKEKENRENQSIKEKENSYGG